MNGRILKNRYQIVRELGTGGQGITYLAEDLSLSGKPHCVVKQLRPADPKTLDLARRLFEQEINALGRLGDHPQIPRLLARLEEGDQFYLVQQYIEGDPLSQYIVPGQPWSENQVNGMLRELLPILDFIHSKGVIHRDIKPNNIIRRKYDQKLVLIDFGSIKQVISSELIITQQNQVRTTVIVGTEGYMPHQQKQGNVSPSSDLYAIGMMAIEAVTGISAIDLQMQYSDPQTGEIIWRRLAPQISDHLANILSKIIAYIPGNRYQSAKDIQKDLGIVIDNPSHRKTDMTNSNQQYSNVLPVGKFCFLNIITFGFYQIPWCHKQWKFLKEKDDLNINPWLYACFFPFTIYSLAKKVFHLAEKEGYPNRPSAGGVTALYWFFLVLSISLFLLLLLSWIPLVSILKAVNYYWEQEEG